MRLRDDEPDLPAQINIVPMIDVIFAILTFFIMSSLGLTRSEGLPVNLPEASNSQLRVEPLEALVTLRPDGQLFLNKTAIALDQLAPAVAQLRGQTPQILVVINADQAVPHGQVVQLMDQLQPLQGVKVALATQKP